MRSSRLLAVFTVTNLATIPLLEDGYGTWVIAGTFDHLLSRHATKGTRCPALGKASGLRRGQAHCARPLWRHR